MPLYVYNSEQEPKAMMAFAQTKYDGIQCRIALGIL